MYKLVFILETLVTIFNNDALNPRWYLVSLTTDNISTRIVVFRRIVYLSLKAIVVCDVLDCSHVAVRFLDRVLAHYGISVTCLLLRVSIPSAYVRYTVTILVAWIGLQDNLQSIIVIMGLYNFLLQLQDLHCLFL